MEELDLQLLLHIEKIQKLKQQIKEYTNKKYMIQKFKLLKL